MSEILLAGTLIDVAQFVIACGGIWIWLRILDWGAGATFRETYRTIRSRPIAAALYLGLRFIASAILFAAVVG